MTELYRGPAGRFVYWDGLDVLAGVEGQVRGMTPPGVESVLEELTGPSNLAPIWTEVGAARPDDFVYEAHWSTNTADVVKRHRAGYTPSARALVWGYGTDAVGKAFEGAKALDTKRVFDTPNMGLTLAHITHRLTGGIFHGLSFGAKAAHTADYDTTAASLNGGTQSAAMTITSSSVANPTHIVATAHGFLTGDTVLQAGHSGSTPSINGSYTVTYIDANTYSIPVNVTVGGTGGTATRTSSRNGGAGFLEVFALNLDGGTSATALILDSQDNITFATLVTFVNVTAAPNGQCVEVTGTVDRYTAASVAFNGGAGAAKSITPFIGFARL